jgi:hypothetical protein
MAHAILLRPAACSGTHGRLDRRCQTRGGHRTASRDRPARRPRQITADWLPKPCARSSGCDWRALTGQAMNGTATKAHSMSLMTMPTREPAAIFDREGRLRYRELMYREYMLELFTQSLRRAQAWVPRCFMRGGMTSNARPSLSSGSR